MIKPIIFSTDSVRAILDGRKVMTRRVVKPQPDCPYVGFDHWQDSPKDSDVLGPLRRIPYAPGDVLWVRETWQEVYETEYNQDDPIHPIPIRDMILNFDAIQKTCVGLSRQCSCHAMMPRNKYYIYAANNPKYAGNWKEGLFWRSSTQMPREAARIFLRVTDVRVERLQEISDADAWREGVDMTDVLSMPCRPDKAATAVYSGIWEHINAKRGYGWESNPYVWIISFERIDKNEALQQMPSIKAGK